MTVTKILFIRIHFAKLYKFLRCIMFFLFLLGRMPLQNKSLSYYKSPVQTSLRFDWSPRSATLIFSADFPLPSFYIIYFLEFHIYYYFFTRNLNFLVVITVFCCTIKEIFRKFDHVGFSTICFFPLSFSMTSYPIIFSRIDPF